METLDKLKGIAIIILLFGCFLFTYGFSYYEGAEDGYRLTTWQALLEYQSAYISMFSLGIGLIVASFAIVLYINYYKQRSPSELTKELLEELNE